MATKNAINSNIPIELTKGGTNASSLSTTNGVVYYDGTRLVTTSAGTSGQVLTSQGAGLPPVYGAGPSVTNAMVLISSQTASASSSIDFTTGITYANYLLIFENVTPTTNGSTIALQFTDDGGATWKSTSYISGAFYSASGSSTNNTNITTGIILYPLCGNLNTANSGYSFILNCGTSKYTTLRGEFTGRTTVSANCFAGFTGGYYNATLTVNGFRVLAISDTIATGTFSLFGISNS